MAEPDDLTHYMEACSRLRAALREAEARAERWEHWAGASGAVALIEECDAKVEAAARWVDEYRQALHQMLANSTEHADGRITVERYSVRRARDALREEQPQGRWFSADEYEMLLTATIPADGDTQEVKATLRQFRALLGEPETQARKHREASGG